MNGALLPAALEHRVAHRTPTLWINEHWRTYDAAAIPAAQNPSEMYDAEARLNGFTTALMVLFPSLIHARGIIESPLLDADRLQLRMSPRGGPVGRWLIKADHALPVAGSVKARGGVYEVLLHAESVARRHGLMNVTDDGVMLALPPARELFARLHGGRCGGSPTDGEYAKCVLHRRREIAASLLGI